MSIDVKFNLKHIETAQALVHLAYEDLKNVEGMRQDGITKALFEINANLAAVIEEIKRRDSNEA